MSLTINEEKLKEGLLGLVIALVEIITEILKLQAIKRMSGGHLSEDSIERLGQNIMDLEAAIERIKEEQGLIDSVNGIRDSLDDVVGEFLNSFDCLEV